MEDKIIDTMKAIGNKLNEDYLKGGTKSQRKRLVYELYSFEVLCAEEFGIKNKHLWTVDEELIPDKDPFTDIIKKDKKNLFNISKTVIESFISSNFPFYHDYNKELPRMNVKQIKEIVLDFLNSFDVNTANKLQEKIKENKVFITRLEETNGGFLNPFEILNDGIIVVNNIDGYNLEFAKYLVHECGHLFELEHLYSQNRRIYRNNSMLTPYYEVSSSFLEYAFLRYLKDNRILNHSIDIMLNEFFLELFVGNFYMHILCMKNNIDSEYIYITEDNIKEYANSIMERSNYYGPLYYDKGLDYRNSFIYPIGELMAIYLYENYKQGKENFIKEFKRSFLIYPSNPTLESFNKVGINYQELKEGKVLKRILNEYKTKF